MKRRKSLQERNGGTLLLFLGHVGIGERKREKISWSSCDGGTRGQGRGRTGKSVRHDIFCTRPNGMKLNSKRPKGVIMAVFGMSSFCMGT
jgi:hypothetical protein